MLKSILKLPKKLSALSFLGTTAITLLLVPTTYSFASSINSIFLVTKSDNGNQVHYGVEINSDCSFKTSQPIYPYWKLESGKLEGLLGIEVPIFGIAGQSVSGNDVFMEINALRGRGISKPIGMRSIKSEGQGCNIFAFTQINGEVAGLSQVHIDWTRNGFFGLGGTLHSITFYGMKDNYETIVCEANCSF